MPTPLEASHDEMRGLILAVGRELRRMPKLKRREILLKRMARYWRTRGRHVVAKRLSKADHERIKAELAIDRRNRELPDVPDSEKVLKVVSCGHSILVHPDYQPTPTRICPACVGRRTMGGVDWWAKMPKR